ncbi:hypothetical protein CK203_007326 [Vitis vinifera]|uniref:Uncharacterized protein n=1 Tax=Vitis vinifera TaxID=29760 RepID=A0A438G1L4_VITVI|nr:hypothetical protein CK203_007326 [Vitis vinifera]
MNEQALSNYPESLSNKFNVPIQQLREPYNACMSFYCPTGNPNPAFFLLLNLFLVLLNFDMKMHIRTAACWGAGEAVKLEEIQVKPPKSSEVRVKMLYASLSHTDILYCSGFHCLCFREFQAMKALAKFPIKKHWLYQCEQPNDQGLGLDDPFEIGSTKDVGVHCGAPGYNKQVSTEVLEAGDVVSTTVVNPVNIIRSLPLPSPERILRKVVPSTALEDPYIFIKRINGFRICNGITFNCHGCDWVKMRGGRPRRRHCSVVLVHVRRSEQRWALRRLVWQLEKVLFRHHSRIASATIPAPLEAPFAALGAVTRSMAVGKCAVLVPFQALKRRRLRRFFRPPYKRSNAVQGPFDVGEECRFIRKYIYRLFIKGFAIGLMHA